MRFQHLQDFAPWEAVRATPILLPTLFNRESCSNSKVRAEITMWTLSTRPSRRTRFSRTLSRAVRRSMYPASASTWSRMSRNWSGLCQLLQEHIARSCIEPEMLPEFGFGGDVGVEHVALDREYRPSALDVSVRECRHERRFPGPRFAQYSGRRPRGPLDARFQLGQLGPVDFFPVGQIFWPLQNYFRGRLKLRTHGVHAAQICGISLLPLTRQHELGCLPRFLSVRRLQDELELLNMLR